MIPKDGDMLNRSKGFMMAFTPQECARIANSEQAGASKNKVVLEFSRTMGDTDKQLTITESKDKFIFEANEESKKVNMEIDVDDMEVLKITLRQIIPTFYGFNTTETPKSHDM